MATTTIKEATKRSPSQRIRVLTALRNAGSKGITNVELQEISLRWQARLSELYKQGYRLALQNWGDGVYNYTLIHEPDTIHPEPRRAIQVLISEIENKFSGNVTTSQLMDLLNSNGLQVGRKPGSFTVKGI
ncbi:hypothetical protein GRF59_05450 [Paenibacillus sp. HJL G12]|uniref:Uncharacterized protein n=1 Tax=Paenibacillus dendrobii TaxID=2691084 RepID=A0A7X3LHC5_9BACL|nr:hypothetical protein [Paenibacillus dendrobii]MWV43069.1 hypothetical protein [Paenibacillus dendrobii]